MAQRRKVAAVKRPKKATTVKKVTKKATAKVAAKKVASTAEKNDLKASSKGSTLNIYDMSGKTVDTMSLDPIFHEGKINSDVIHQAVVMYQAGKREGTASTKDRGAVSGGGKKPWKQKGTGRARHASIRSPLWKGGGVTFGPQPRDYSYSIPVQVRRTAVAEGVKSIVSQGKLFMLKELTLDAPKTKKMVKILSAFKAEKPLVVVDKKHENVVLASRNIQGLSIKTSEEVNALDVVSHRECLMTQSAYNGLLKRLKS